MNPDAGYPQLLWGASDGTHGGYMDGVPGAIELPMEAGDALIRTLHATLLDPLSLAHSSVPSC